MPHLTRRAWLAVALAVAGLGAAGIAIAGAQGDEPAVGTDPLSTDELDVAAALARGSNPGEAAGLGDDDVVLLVERHEEAKGAELRRADVYVYSYDDDVLTLTVVDLATGEPRSTTIVPNTQLPLVQEEQDRAVQLLMDHAGARRALATAYRQATGRDLADVATDVIIDPIVFRADANPQAAAGAARRCGTHRCAQLLLRSADDLLINLFPVIDLSTGRVATTGGRS